jgi:uncharacterized protein
MIEQLKALILDFQSIELDTGYPRELQIEEVPGKATVVIGVRRSGKSTYLYQKVAALLRSGVPRENILFLNFFDDRLHHLEQEGLSSIAEAYYALFPEKKNTETVHCFFDEIQAIPGWEPFVDRLMRTEKCQISITGSSARMLSREIATQMRGRSLSWELFPFSFHEFLGSREIECQGALSTKARLKIQKGFETYWQCGGFPEVLGLERHLRIKIHQEYFHAVLFRDLVERHDVSHPRAILDLARRLIDNVASLYSINSLTGYLRSLGHKLPKSAVSQYVEWFQDAFFLFTVKIFDASLKRQQANPKKIYCIDQALVTSVSSGILVNSGHLLENLVFSTLRRITTEIWYYKTRKGHEVDFLVQRADRSRFLVQACETLADPKTKKRELTALTDAMEELDIRRSTIVTRHEEEEIAVESGMISVVPAWKYLLDSVPAPDRASLRPR